MTALKILVIRRDNIGDLVCTTPLIHALRTHLPTARICALANSYNLPVLENNPDLSQLFFYSKAKHQSGWWGIFKAYWDRLRLIMRLRMLDFDHVILAAPGFQPRSLRFARLIGARHIIGFAGPGKEGAEHIDIRIPYALPRPMHEAEDVFRLLVPLGIQGTPGPARVFPDTEEVRAAQAILDGRAWPKARPLVGIHISARKASQRWPAQNFVGLAETLHERNGCAFLLLWSPGDNTNPMHPGDDAKAKEIMDALPDVPILAYPTQRLVQLIAGLSLCDQVICSDGGAMHLAAGLGKPVLCFFGKSDASRWHPWGVPHVLLQPASLEVADIGVEDALAGFARLLEKF